MKKDGYRARIIDNLIKDYLQAFGAICIEGPKWCGKTWAAENISNSHFMLGDPTNNFQNRKLASLSPSMVLQGDVPRLIDEWQEVESLWDAVRYEVDVRHQQGHAASAEVAGQERIYHRIK